jgi:hypothetical protein
LSREEVLHVALLARKEETIAANSRYHFVNA